MATKIVLRTHRGTVVYSGWRAWLMGAAGFVIVFAGLALITFLLFGIVATLGALLLLLIPAAIVMALAARLFGGGPTSGR